jgi:hypothetical protein
MRKLLKFILKKIINFSDRPFNFDGQKVVLLCNGPSLNDVDFSRVTVPMVGLNKIHLKEDVRDRLSFVVAVNKLVVRQLCKSFEARKYHRCTPVFIPSHRMIAKLFLRKSLLLNVENSINFASRGNSFGVGSTVTYVALQLIYRFNASAVYVVGMDHNFDQSGRHNEKQLLEGTDSNHFDPNYFANMKWQLADLPSSEKSYFRAKEEYELAGKKIYLVGQSKYNGWERLSLEAFYREVNE